MKWVNIIFFAFTMLVTLIGVPLYILKVGMPPPVILALTIFYAVATGMSITVGYHRLFAHSTFKANPVIEFILLFFGAAAFEQTALRWASQHRDHHRYVDTDQDPYSIKKGFFYAHIGWLIFWVHPLRLENSLDLQKNKLLMHQHKYYLLWCIGSGVLLPTLLGALCGHALAAFIFAVCARLVFVHHSTFCINSVCHMFGKATYDIYATARDHWFVAFLTNGEGYHNFHHRFPGDYRNGVRWYQWDPSKWMISFLASIRLVSDLKKVSPFRILEAKLRADQQRVRDWLTQGNEASRWERLCTDVEAHYKILHERLHDWEAKSREYRRLVYGRIQEHSQAIKTCTQQEEAVSRGKFQLALGNWQLLIKSNARLASLVF